MAVCRRESSKERESDEVKAKERIGSHNGGGEQTTKMAHTNTPHESSVKFDVSATCAATPLSKVTCSTKVTCPTKVPCSTEVTDITKVYCPAHSQVMPQTSGISCNLVGSNHVGSVDACPQPFSIAQVRDTKSVHESQCLGHVDRQDESLRAQGASHEQAWRNGSSQLEQDAMPVALGGTGGREHHGISAQRSLSASEDGNRDQQGSSPQVRPAILHDRDTGNANQWPRGHQSVEAQGTESCIPDHHGSSSGLHGVRPVLPPVLSGSDGGAPGVCDLGSRSGQGRSGLSQVGPLPEVDREESYATTGRDSKVAEVPEQTKVIEQSQPIGTDPDSEGAGSECAEDVFRDQGPQGRPTRTSEDEQHVLKGRDYFERMGEHDGAQRVLNSAGKEPSRDLDQGLWLGEFGTSGKLESSHVNSLCQAADRAVPDQFMSLVHYERPILFELACGPNSRLTDEMRRQTKRESSAQRLSFWNGFDFTNSKSVRSAIDKIDKERPTHVWMSFECGPYSVMQNANQRTASQKEELQQKRANCIRQYVGGLVIYTHCCQQGIPCTWEWSETCDAWRLPMVQRVFHKFNPFMVVTKGCRVGLRDSKTRGLMQKGWKLATTHEGLARAMELPCTCTGAHVKCQGKLTKESAYYTDEFARKVCRALLHEVSWQGLTAELMGENGGPKQFCGHMMSCTCSEIQHPKSDLKCHSCMSKTMEFSWVNDEELPPLTEAEKERCMKQLSMIHRNTGHGTVEHMVQALERRNTDPRIVELAKKFTCSVCHEQKRHVPRPRVHLEPLPPKWQSLQADVAYWKHPGDNKMYQILVMIDEGCRFRMAQVTNEGRGIKGSDMIDFFQRHWKPVFGCPDKIRVDPAGPLRSEEVTNYFSNLGVEVDLIPAEAHWQNSHAERAIQSTKHVMQRLLTADPGLSVHEALSEAIRVENEREIVRGYSPAQHALGRSPDHSGKLHVSTIQDLPVVLCENSEGEVPRNLERMKQAEMAFQEWVFNERISRAKNTRSYRQETFSPGDLVFVWRVQGKTKGPANSSKVGGFTGPARVLATETRQDEQGHYRPGSAIWVIRGNRLLKTAPQQLRRASTREQCLEELQNPPELPWTMTKLMDDLGPRQYDDVSDEIPEDMEWERGIDEEQNPGRPPHRITGKRFVPECPGPNPPNIPPSLRDDQMGDNGDDNDDDLLHERQSNMEKSHENMESDFHCFWNQSDAAVEINIDVPETNRGKKHMIDRFSSFLVSNLKRRTIEVNEKHLDEKEYAEMQEAKQCEVKKFLAAEALEALPEHLQPPKHLAMRMRWVLTWKRDDQNNKSAKARCVILGFLDPMYEYRQTHAPTMSRMTRQIFLAIAAANGWDVEKGDVSGAFLQGREYPGEAYVIPTPEICMGMKIPESSVTKLRKACYGLVDAPLEWFLTVSDFLTSIGFVRCVTDPCCFKYVKNDRLIGLITGHVDDFLFSGNPTCPLWKDLCDQIKRKFKWGSWEKNEFTQCGVHIKRTSDMGFELTQTQYIEDLQEISVSAERRKQPQMETNEKDKTRLRAVLGGLSWCAQQVCPHVTAAVSLLLSEVTTSTVQTMLEVNKLVYQVKMNKGHKMIIHGGVPMDKLIVAGWADAACQNRKDGKSTQGIFVALTSGNLLSGELCKVSPVYWASSKIQRQCRSPGAAESLAAIDCEDVMYAVRLQLFEMTGGVVNVRRTGMQVSSIPAVLVTDSTNVYDKLHTEVYVPKGPERRVSLEMLGLKQAIEETRLDLRWVHSDAQLANSLTKDNEQHQLNKFYQLGHRWKIVEDEEMKSAKRRKKLGLDALEDGKRSSGAGWHVSS